MGASFPNDKEKVSRITYEAMDFAERYGATDGQINAVRKTLTDRGYHLIK